MLVNNRREALGGHAAMLAFSALVAGSFSLGGMVAGEIAPAALNVVRFTIAAAVMGGLALATGQLRRETFAAPWRFAVIGALFAAYFILMFEGLKTAPPVSTSAVFTLTPVMSGVFGWLLIRQVASPRMALALGIGAAGALWVIFRADLGALLRFEVGRGEATFFWGCMSYALFAPVSRMLNRGEKAFGYTFAIIVAAVALMALYGWRDLSATDWRALRPLVWVTILYTAVLAGAVTTALQQFAVLRLPSAKVMAYTYLTPTWVTLWEVALGHAVPPARVLVGVALTVVALLLLLKDEPGDGVSQRVASKVPEA